MSYDVAPLSPYVTQQYGCTDNPMEFPAPNCAGGFFHCGIDLMGNIGDPVYATRSGIVVAVGTAYGLGPNAVCYEADGLYFWYGHLSSTSVAVGDRVYSGGEIGRIGSLGASTGPHLHFESRTDGPYQHIAGSIDPRPYFNFASPSFPDNGGLPLEVHTPAISLVVPGSYDIMDGVNPALTKAFCNVRNFGAVPATGVMVFVRRSDGVAVTSRTFFLAPGAGDELGVGLPGDGITDAGTFVVQLTSGRVSASGKTAS